MKNIREQRSKAFSLDGFAGREGKSAHRASMKAAMKRNEFIAPGMVSRELHRGLNRFRAGISKIDAFPCTAGRDGSEFLCQFDHSRVIKIRAGHVDQF